MAPCLSELFIFEDTTTFPETTFLENTNLMDKYESLVIVRNEVYGDESTNPSGHYERCDRKGCGLLSISNDKRVSNLAIFLDDPLQTTAPYINYHIYLLFAVSDTDWVSIQIKTEDYETWENNGYLILEKSHDFYSIIETSMSEYDNALLSANLPKDNDDAIVVTDTLDGILVDNPRLWFGYLETKKTPALGIDAGVFDAFIVLILDFISEIVAIMHILTNTINIFQLIIIVVILPLGFLTTLFTALRDTLGILKGMIENGL